MHKVKTAVVILNWNGKKFLEQFLPSVVKYSSADAELIVADNDSKDDSIDFLKAHYPSVKIIQNNENGGYAKGYNDALKQIDAEYYVLLNSDIEVAENWINPVIQLMDSDKSIAACQPKIRSFFKKDEFEYAGAAGGYIDRYGYPFCKGRIFQHLEKDLGQYNEVYEIFWATGACMFVRAEIFHKLNGFDEFFFAHMEEIDLCWRMKNAGFKLMYCPNSVIFHVGGGTLPKNNPRKTFLNFRNNLILLYKNLTTKRVYVVFFIRLFLDFIAALKFLAEGHFRDCLAVIKAYYHFYRYIGKYRKFRKKTPQKKVSCLYTKSIVLDHYFRGKKVFSQLDQSRFRK